MRHGHLWLLVLVLGCAKGRPVSDVRREEVAQRDEVVRRDEDVGGAMGRRVTLEGTAENAKSGAVVLVEDAAIYVRGLDSWPDELYQKRVRVTGVLGKDKLAPDPVVGPNGEQSAGMWGESTVVKEATWELAP